MMPKAKVKTCKRKRSVSPKPCTSRAVAAKKFYKANEVRAMVERTSTESDDDDPLGTDSERRAHPDVPSQQVPHKLTKTVFRCSSCQVYLCIRKNSTCWRDYHSKIQYWR